MPLAITGQHRSAVVQGGPYQVELVAALRPVLVGPPVAGLGVHEQAVRVAVCAAPDPGQGAGPPDERVVVGHAAVVGEADSDPWWCDGSCAGCAARSPGVLAIQSPTEGEEVAVAVPGEPAAVVAAAP